MDISWFMRIINEGIARVTNQEDDSTKRFWESRFSSLALLDEKALVDSLTNSDHTSIKRRCEQAAKVEQPNEPQQQTDGLHPFADNPRRDTWKHFENPPTIEGRPKALALSESKLWKSV
jgi:hypothetical protein